mmetsp:Transcript_33194/g.64698  ORF Transcript_33194/g.64698 Transcript_33194/m.64698 type:complete len:205 (+) Transcript_33194:74-688(+)
MGACSANACYIGQRDVGPVDIEALTQEAIAECDKPYVNFFQGKEKFRGKQAFPYILFERLEGRNKITECKNAEEKFYENILEYMVATNRETLKVITDNIWNAVVAPKIRPAIQMEAEEAVQVVPKIVKEKFGEEELKDKAIRKRMASTRRDIDFDNRIQRKLFTICVENMKRNGAVIAEDYDPATAPTELHSYTHEFSIKSKMK